MKSVIFLVSLFLVCAAWAETQTMQVTNESRSRFKDQFKNKKFEEDTSITDTKIKADAGSLSRYSFKADLSYYGPPVGDITNKEQPNPDHRGGNFTTNLSGSIGGRYRLNSNSALSFSGGLKVVAPFHGIDRAELKTPGIYYDRTYTMGDAQLRSGFGVSYNTDPTYRSYGQYAGSSLSQSVVWKIMKSKLATGTDFSFSVFFYDKELKRNEKKMVSNYFIGVYPFLKYYLNDKTDVKTSLAYQFANDRRKNDYGVLDRQTVTQRLGVGYAYTRDVYFLPYLDFYPQQFAWDTTTISFSTVFSVF